MKTVVITGSGVNKDTINKVKEQLNENEKQVVNDSEYIKQEHAKLMQELNLNDYIDILMLIDKKPQEKVYEEERKSRQELRKKIVIKVKEYGL